MMKQRQRHTRGEPQTRGGLHEAAHLLVDHACGSRRKEQNPGEARMIRLGRSLSSTRTYTEVTFCSRLLPQMHARMSCSLFLVWIPVSLFLLPLQPHDFLDDSQYFGLQPVEAVNPDNVDYKDVKERCPRRHYVRRPWTKHSSEKTETSGDSLFARNKPYVFEAVVPRQRGTEKTGHHSEKGAFGSASGAQGTAKTCALLVLAHDWPLSPRRGEGSHTDAPFSWSEQWYYLRQELERRAEFDAVYVIAPDVSSSSGGNEPVVTSLHHYAAYLARQTRLMLQALLQPDREPEPEPRASVAERQAALAARLAALFPHDSPDDVFSVPLPDELVARWFTEASESPGGSRRTSQSSSVQPFSTSRSGPSSAASSIHDLRQRQPDAPASSSFAASSVPGGPQAGSSSPTLPPSNVDAGAASGSPPSGSQLYSLFQKSRGARGRAHTIESDPSQVAGAAMRSTRKTRMRLTRSHPAEEDTRVIWTSEGDTVSGSTEEEVAFTGASSCAQVDLFLLGHGVGGLALRLMAASPSSTLWDDPEDERKHRWKEEVLAFHLWLSGKLLDSGAGRSSAEAGFSPGSQPRQRRSAGSVPQVAFSKRETLSLPRGSSRNISVSGRYSSGSAHTNISNVSCTTVSSSASLQSSSQLGRLGSSEQVDRSHPHRLSSHHFMKAARTTTGEAAAESPRRCLYGPIVQEETGDEEESEEDEGEDDFQEEEDCRATQTETSQSGVRLRTVLLDHTPLAGVGSLNDEGKSTRSRLKAMTFRTKWEWSAVREAVRKSLPQRAPPRPSADLKRTLLHLDGPRVLCMLAHEEKQSYTMDKDMRGSLVMHFGNVLYYGGLSTSNPSVTASQLGIAYPFLMQSAAAQRVQHCNDPKRPCKMIDVAASSLNSPVDAGRGRPSRWGEAGRIPANQAEDSPASPAASVDVRPRESTGFFGFWRRIRRGSQRSPERTGAVQDSGLSTRRDGDRKREPHASSESTEDSTLKKGRPDAAAEKVAEEESSEESMASIDTSDSVVPHRMKNRRKAAAIADSGQRRGRDEAASEEGYEGEVESDSTAEDSGGDKRHASSTAKDYRRGLSSAAQRSHGMHVLLFSVDICRMTSRTNLYDVTLTLLEAINQNQHPHAYNPARFGIWETVRTDRGSSSGPSKEGEGKDTSHSRDSKSSMPPEGMTEEKERVLLHMAVRFFQESKSVKRWDFSGDKSIYSKEWFTNGHGHSRAHCGRHARGLQS